MINFTRIVLTFLTLCALGCQRPPETPVVKQSREVMGTLAEVTAYAADKTIAATAVEAAYAQFDKVNRLMSDYVADSEIGQLNALSPGRSITVSPETFDVLTQALAVAKASGGAFDITCRPLVQLWKQAGKDNILPDQASIDAVLHRIGPDKLTLDPATRTVTPSVEGLQVDLGGIAKGYALDLAAAAMKQAGATAGLVNIGGDVLGFGQQPSGKLWRIGIQSPFESDLAGVIELTNWSVATSGIQQRFSVIQDKRYSHIIDPRTGWPATQAPSVTVIAHTGATADAWATVFSVLAVDQGKPLAESLNGIEVLWIWGTIENPQTTETPGFKNFRVEQ